MPWLTLLLEGLILNEENANNRQRKPVLLLLSGGNGRSRYLFHPPKHRKCEGLQQSGRPAERILRSTGRHDGRQSLLQTAHTSRDPGRQFDSLLLNPDVQ